MLEKLKQALTSFHNDDAGAMKVEMILILVLISIPLLIVLYLFRERIVGWFNEKVDDLEDKVNSGG
ncbi:MAG: hypothetical protein FWD53_07445 [Phycisphaerales bacterium]|nr:hypothetical protein [Phycisphaerales bacterium]